MRYWASWVSGGSSQMDVGASPARALRPPHMRTGGVGCAGLSAAKRLARCRPGPRSLLGERERAGRAVRGSTGAGGSSGHLPLLAAQHSRKTFEAHCASRGKAPDACRAAAGPPRPRRGRGGDRVAQELPSPAVAFREGKTPGEALRDRKLGRAEEPWPERGFSEETMPPFIRPGEKLQGRAVRTEDGGGGRRVVESPRVLPP